MATEEIVDATLEILKRIQADQAGHRKETRDLQQSLVDVVRLIQRLDTRVSDIKADLETMFKMELVGQHAHHETRIEQILQDSHTGILERLDRIEARLNE